MPNLDFFIVGKGPVVLFLHGWGQNKEMMFPIVDLLKKNYTCLVIDMPGFGNSKYNDEKDIKEYVKTIHDFINTRLNLKISYIVGHSFGGKVGLEYYFEYGVKGLVFIASPILKPTRNIDYYYRVITHKLKKKLHIKSNGGSKDYLECDDKMKKFFVSIVNTHYNKKIKNIIIPVLLIYSKDDDKVDVKKGKLLSKKILRSKLRVINGDHFAYLSNREIVESEINNFFKEREKHAYYL